MRGAGSLVLVRHGESTANAAQRFTDLLDVELTYVGEQQARAGARLLATSGSVPDVVLTSPLRRARQTALDIVSELGIDVPVRELWRLEERDYGAITGAGTRRVWEQYGSDRFVEWRRTVNGRPPAADPEQVASWNLAGRRPCIRPEGPVPVRSPGRRRQRVLGRLTPTEYEMIYNTTAHAA